MKTFLGVHYPSTGQRNGLGVFLDAGAAGLACFDCGYENQPRPFYATRFTVDGQDNPPDFYTDPFGSGQRWIDALRTKWSQNPGAQCRILNNELDIETPWHAAQQNIFNLSAMQYLDSLNIGERAGICSYAGGNPSDNALVDGTPCSLEERWRPMLPSVKYAGEHGHYVVLHIHQQDKGNMESPGGQSISLRHRRSIAYWLNNAAHPECVITVPPRIIFNEVSTGVGGEEPNPDQYFNSVTWLDQYMRSDPYNSLYTVLGLYQAGGAEPISSAMYSRLATYVSQQDEITINPLPGGQPVEEWEIERITQNGQDIPISDALAITMDDNETIDVYTRRKLPFHTLSVVIHPGDSPLQATPSSGLFRHGTVVPIVIH